MTEETDILKQKIEQIEKELTQQKTILLALWEATCPPEATIANGKVVVPLTIKK